MCRRDSFISECLLRIRPSSLLVVGDRGWAAAAGAIAGLAAGPNSRTPECRVADTWPDGAGRADVGIVADRLVRSDLRAVPRGLEQSDYVIILLEAGAPFDLGRWEEWGLIAAAWPDHASAGAVLLSREDPRCLRESGPGLEAGAPMVDPLAARRELLERTRATAAVQAAALASIRGSASYRAARWLSQSSLAHLVGRVARPGRPWVRVRSVSGTLVVLAVHDRREHLPLPWDFVHFRGRWTLDPTESLPRPARAAGPAELRLVAPDPSIALLAHEQGGPVEISFAGRVRRLDLRAANPAPVEVRPGDE